MKYVNKPVRKKDAMALVTGKPVFLDDVPQENCLVVKLLRSPHARALVKQVKKDTAMKIPGIVGIYTWEDVPDIRFTNAGQTYPEASPYDRKILDQQVRFVGDPVAIIAGETEEAVDRAMKMVKVTYEVQEPLLDFRKAKDNEILVHPEENWKSLIPVGADNKRNLCAHEVDSMGDVDAILAECDVVLENTYHTKANQQAMMETFRTMCYMDVYGRMHIVSSTQIVFHVRRIVATALGIPKSKIHVTKPRIGGGFGAKQTAVCEVYPAFVTWTTKRASKLIFTREESMIASSPRHEMEIKMRMGAMKDGTIRAIDVYTVSNTGAYGEHGPTTAGLSGHKTIPLYTPDAYRFVYDVVYTNVMAAGAYRGYGATQGCFAMESMVNEMADKLGLDPAYIREKNMVKEGQMMPAYYGEPNNSCALDRCLARVKEMIKWEEKFPCRDLGNGKVRSVGLAMCMQGSGISGLDMGSASIKLNEDGIYTLAIGSADMGTGCDTILAQMAAECMDCSVDSIMVIAADTDASPYDSGSYASSTTYVTGKAVEKACMKLREKITAGGAKLLGIDAKEAVFDGHFVYKDGTDIAVSVEDIATAAMDGHLDVMQAVESNTSPYSPPPFMAGAVEIELDKETGDIEIVDYAAVVDCGTVINPNLARVQVEGGLVQGIGMALYEDATYSEKGAVYQNSLMQYKVPTRLDMGKLRVAFESSYEPTGPFGAKSIGEIVINTPSPAIAHAIANATGLRFKTLPITKEQIAMGILEQES